MGMNSSLSPTVFQRLALYARLVRIDKPIGILLLVWPTLWALWAASQGRPSLYYVFAFVAGTALMRSAGCAINDYFDRDVDRYVERTRDRVLTSGLITANEALGVSIALALVSLVLILPMNKLVWALSVVAVFLAATYPKFKRFFAIPQAYLGIAFGFGIPMAYAAVLETIPLEGWIMLAANIFWAVAYDTEYAMVDRDDDIKLGLRTAAITFGRWDVAMVGVCYAVTLALLALAGAMAGYGWAYGCGLAAAGVIAVRHLRWIRGRDRAACFRAFLHNTWFGASVFAGIFAQTVLVPLLG